MVVRILLMGGEASWHVPGRCPCSSWICHSLLKTESEIGEKGRGPSRPR
jgi:hypothetical protein